MLSVASCSHSWNEDEPWWVVDMQAVYNVTSVKVRNRLDCCGKAYVTIISHSNSCPTLMHCHCQIPQLGRNLPERMSAKGCPSQGISIYPGSHIGSMGMTCCKRSGVLNHKYYLSVVFSRCTTFHISYSKFVVGPYFILL